LEITGKIIELLPKKSGQSANGDWRKQEYIMETDGQYPKKICFLVWGEKIDQFNIKQGENLEVSVDLESREYNGRWYTDVKAWRVSRNSVGADYPQSTPTKGDDTLSPPILPQIDDGDMPF
jgi:hypothetical protein